MIVVGGRLFFVLVGVGEGYVFEDVVVLFNDGVVVYVVCVVYCIDLCDVYLMIVEFVFLVNVGGVGIDV